MADDEETPATTEGADAFTDALSSGAGVAAQHELQPAERTGHHRLIMTAMLVTIVFTALSQGWVKHLQQWITEKTHPPVQKASSGG